MPDANPRAPSNRPSPGAGRRLVAVAVALSLLGGCAGGAGDDVPPAENLLLVTVDTLRPDRLGNGGNPRQTSPVIDALARRGVVFDNAYSAAGWTLPSVASLLTGLPPGGHGATRVGRAIESGAPTLATILHDRGYSTAAFVSQVLLSPTSGFDRGFDRYDDSVLDRGHPHAVSTAEALTDKVIAALDSLPPPFFVWVHYFDPHFRYLVHAESAEFGGHRLDRYDGEIRHVDHHLGRLLDELEARGLAATTVVVLTGDHGEEFGEHGGRYHFTLHQEVVRVPLLLVAPGLKPGVRGEAVRGVDVAPTALGLVGIEPPPELEGRDLLAGPPPESAPPVFFERDRPTAYRQRGVIDGPLKLVVVEQAPNRPPNPRTGRGPKLPTGVFLWNLDEDPGETVSLYDPDDPEARRLLALVESRFSSSAGDVEGPEVDDELRRQLEALGYVP